MTDILSERLLACMQLGITLHGADGHIWIEIDKNIDEYHTFEHMLVDNGISLNNKIYGGILEALDTIDECLKIDSADFNLEEFYNPDIQFLGEPGPDMSRIDMVEKGKGGLY